MQEICLQPEHCQQKQSSLIKQKNLFPQTVSLQTKSNCTKILLFPQQDMWLCLQSPHLQANTWIPTLDRAYVWRWPQADTLNAWQSVGWKDQRKSWFILFIKFDQKVFLEKQEPENQLVTLFVIWMNLWFSESQKSESPALSFASLRLQFVYLKQGQFKLYNIYY